jgi:hypothetical protein
LFPSIKRQRFDEAKAGALAAVASGLRGLVYLDFIHSSTLRLLELDVRKDAREIEHVIDQHQAHQDQITTQDLERQTYAWGHCNLSKTIARTLLLWLIVEWMDDTKFVRSRAYIHSCHD